MHGNQSANYRINNKLQYLDHSRYKQQQIDFLLTDHHITIKFSSRSLIEQDVPLFEKNLWNEWVLNN